MNDAAELPRYDRALLRRWSRPETVLLASEQDRLEEWLDLYESQLQQLGGGLRPPIAHRYAARRCAMVVWTFDRATSTRADVEHRRTDIPALKRADEFEEFNIRRRLNTHAIDELDSAREFARAAGQGMSVKVEELEGSVVPFGKKSRRKSG